MKLKRHSDETAAQSVNSGNRVHRGTFKARQALGLTSSYQTNCGNQAFTSKSKAIPQDVIARSIFIGNVPCSVAPYDLKKIFKQYG